MNIELNGCNFSADETCRSRETLRTEELYETDSFVLVRFTELKDNKITVNIRLKVRVSPTVPGYDNAVVMRKPREVDLHLLLIHDELHWLLLIDGNKKLLHVLDIIGVCAQATVQALILGIVSFEYVNKVAMIKEVYGLIPVCLG